MFILALSFLTLTGAQDTFFEGDILLKNELLSHRSLEMVLQDPNLRWPNGVVPYAFDTLSKLTDDQKATVREAMDSIQEKTGCIDFVMVDMERGGDMVLVTTLGYRSLPGTGCWAHLGRQGGTQVVNLGEEGCFTSQIVTHELLHVLGVVHEHTRPDRDDYVMIIENNIEPSKRHNFAKRNWSEIEYSDVAYNYKSVMHYDMYAASKQPDNLDMITIQPHHEAFEGVGHFSDTLTGIDATKIALAYNCSLKPETLAEFVIDNAWQLQMVQQEHTKQIKELKQDIAKGSFSATLGNSEPVLLEKMSDTGHLSAQLMELTARMEGSMSRMEGNLKQEMEEKEAEIRLEFETRLEEKEKKQKAEVVNVVSNAVKNIPFEVVCSYQDTAYRTIGTITYDRFISNYNNANRPGGGDGQMDLKTGVFTVMTPGHYTVSFSAQTRMYPEEKITIFIFKNGTELRESILHWRETSGSGHIADGGSKTLILHLALGDSLELRATENGKEGLWDITFCLSLTGVDYQ